MDMLKKIKFNKFIVSCGALFFSLWFVCNGCGSSGGDVNLIRSNEDFTTAVSVNINSPIDGNIDGFGDANWHSFHADAGTTYILETTAGTLLDTKLFLFDSDGTTQIKYDNNSGVGDASKITWVCEKSGTYYVVVVGYGNDAGTYTLLVGYDHGNTWQEATHIDVGIPVNGNYETIGDADYFSFDANGGTEYLFSVEGNFGLAYMILYDTNGVTMISNIADHYETPWVCPATGRYYIGFKQYESYLGTYTLLVYCSGNCDDHGDTWQEATFFPVGTTAYGNIEIGGDVDYFSFDASAGVDYDIQANVMTLASGFWFFYDKDGVTQIPAVSPWHCPSSGKYYIKIVSDPPSSTGTYSLLVTVSEQ